MPSFLNFHMLHNHGSPMVRPAEMKTTRDAPHCTAGPSILALAQASIKRRILRRMPARLLAQGLRPKDQR